MTRYISLLRGINVGGRRKILMADLKKLYSDLGCLNIQTYIQSGNVIFDWDLEKDATEIETIIYKAIQKHYGYEVPVIIRKVKEIEEIILNNPFATPSNSESLFLMFLKDKPLSNQLEKIKEYSFLPDDFHISGKHIYGVFVGKFSDSKLGITFFEKHLKVSATTRNWKTVNKLFEIATKE
jgi:uncharacterized protein (DUF1697 family)